MTWFRSADASMVWALEARAWRRSEPGQGFGSVLPTQGQLLRSGETFVSQLALLPETLYVFADETGHEHLAGGSFYGFGAVLSRPRLRTTYRWPMEFGTTACDGPRTRGSTRRRLRPQRDAPAVGGSGALLPREAVHASWRGRCSNDSASGRHPAHADRTGSLKLRIIDVAKWHTLHRNQGYLRGQSARQQAGAAVFRRTSGSPRTTRRFPLTATSCRRARRNPRWR